MERNRIPPNVPVESGSGFGVGDASGVGVGESLTSGVGVGVMASFISFCASNGAAKHNKRNNGEKRRNNRIADKSSINYFVDLEIV